MSPAPLRRRLVVPATAAVLALALDAAIVPAPAAHGTPPAYGPSSAYAPARAPKPTESELRKQLNALNTEAEKLTEQFNKTRVRLGRARQAEQRAGQAADALERQAAPAREQLGRLASQNYMNGDPSMMMMSTDSAEGLSDSAYLAQSRAAAVRGLQARIDRAEQARRAAAGTTAQAASAATAAEGAKKTARAKVAQVQAQLDKLGITRVKDRRSGLSATVRGAGRPAKAARAALTRLGKPYVWGASGPNSFDCSGLVVWAYAKVGKPGLPHYTGDLHGMGSKVDRGGLRSGDLVFFGGDLHHMGIYLSGGKYLHAPQTGDVVKISRLSERSDYAGATRIP